MSILTALATLAIYSTAVAVLVLIAVTTYRLNLKRHPFTDCRRCKGTGERRSRLFAHSFGYCPDCHGSGHKVRAGARLLNIR
ncbi:hypothetical protein ACIBCT_31455 [Streptosporangium sp. NPDC050855]|uniref:hypothetical protein n=1 Tax=Streptosporangium sp. NPDC050855 TaxID=3366194 RepID=UPI00379F9A5E